MSIASLLQRIFLGITVLTSMGTLVHDTKIDKAYQLSIPLVSVSTNLSSHLDGLNDGSAHTHVERVSFAQQVNGMPRMQPRDDHRRYSPPKYASRSNPFLGIAGILWPSV